MTVKAEPISVEVTLTPAAGVLVLAANPDRKLLILENKDVDAVRINLGKAFPLNIDEIQTITFSDTPNEGVFRLTFDGQETIDLGSGSNAAFVQGELEALSNVAAGEIVVTGSFGADFVFTFSAGKAASPQPNLSVSKNTLRNNGADMAAVQEIAPSGTPDAGTYKLSFEGDVTSALAFNANAAAIKAALEALPSFIVLSLDVEVTGAGFPASFFVNWGGASTFQPGPRALLVATEVSLIDSAGALNAVHDFTTFGHPSATPTAGMFQIVIAGEVTTELAFDANTAAIQAAIDALASTTPGDIVVTGSLVGGDLVLTYSGATVSATPQPLTGVRNNDLVHQEVPIDVIVTESVAGLVGTPITLTTSEVQAGVLAPVITVTFAETTPGSTDADDGLTIAGGERAVFDVKAPIDELWAKVIGGSGPSTLEITQDA